MPHYADGQPTQEGDIVDVRFRVTAVFSGETACNAQMTGVEQIEGEIAPPMLTTNTKYATLVARAEDVITKVIE